MTTLQKDQSRQSKILGIIFDIDGVLFDSRDANIGYYNLIREAVGLPPMSFSDEKYCHMATSKQSIERIIPKELLPLAFERAQHISYKDFSIPKLKMHAGLIDLLSFLKASHVKRGICTNRMSDVESLLQYFEILHFFDPIKTAGNCLPKPSPQGLLEILNEWNLPSSQVAFLGDSKVDEEAATAADVSFWAFKNQELHASIYANDFFPLMDEIKPLVE